MDSYGQFQVMLDIAYQRPITEHQARQMGKAKRSRTAKSYARRKMAHGTKRF